MIPSKSGKKVSCSKPKKGEPFSDSSTKAKWPSHEKSEDCSERNLFLFAEYTKYRFYNEKQSVSGGVAKKVVSRIPNLLLAIQKAKTSLHDTFISEYSSVILKC